MDVLTLSCSCWKTTGDATDVLRGEYYQVFLFQTIQHTQNISLLCACIHVQSKSDKMLIGESRSCLENPRDGGAWWAAGCGVAQSWTRLKRLSSSSSSRSHFLAGRWPSSLYVFTWPFLCARTLLVSLRRS